MNLTKFHKKAIVASVIADIPRIHSEDIQGRAQKIIDASVVKNAPTALAAVYAGKKLRSYLMLSSTNLGYTTKTGHYIHELPQVSVLSRDYYLDDETRVQLEELVNSALEELKAIRQAEATLTGALEPIRTVKQFLKDFPELKKYAPEQVVASTNLPAIANVMTDLMKMGWPKGETVAA